MTNQKIVKNQVKCNHCGDVIVSVDSINKVTCSCGKTTIGGGNQTLIREGTFTEMTQFLLSD